MNFFSQNSTEYCYSNNAFVLKQEALISVFDMGLLRGHGVFDYAQVYQGHPFHLTDHLLRLKWSCEQVGLCLPKTLDELHEITHAFIEKNNMQNGGIRFVVTGGAPSLDLLLPEGESNLLILPHPYTPNPESYYTKGMCVVTTNFLRLLPSVKTTNYIPAIFAIKKAKERGCDDALYLDADNLILEGTTSNVFFFKNNTWITSNSTEIVKGVTRDVLLRLIGKDVAIEYRSISVDEAISCEEAFLCSSVKDVVPLVQIDGQKIGTGLVGPRTEKLRMVYREYIQSHLLEHICK